jgi:hypothetical protein
MSPQLVFSIANSTALIAWIMLAVLPGRPWVTKMITAKIRPVVFCVLYTAIVSSIFGRVPGVSQLLVKMPLVRSVAAHAAACGRSRANVLAPGLKCRHSCTG